MLRVLFVCTGNICRSPTAEGVFRRMVEDAGLTAQIDSDSAGTLGYHAGRAPDPRAQSAAARRGIDISGLRARKVDSYDFEAFDYILAMDENNFEYLESICPADRRDRLHRLLEFALAAGETSVPDPYYGGENGFEYVLDLIEDASQGLLAQIRREHGF